MLQANADHIKKKQTRDIEEQKMRFLKLFRTI